MRARFSHTAGELRGTAGFGFWNAPYGDPTQRRAALPAALWFFFASATNDLPFAPPPGHGWFAATLDATTPRALALVPLAPAVPVSYTHLDVYKRQPIDHGALRLDPLTRDVLARGRPVELTVTEFNLLWFLASHPRQVFRREKLLEAVWGTSDYLDPGTVTVHIRRLREKIERDPANPAWLQTVWGVGYKFEPEGA